MTVKKRLEEKKDAPGFRELIVMKIKLAIHSRLAALEEKQPRVEDILISLRATNVFGVDFLLQLKEILESYGVPLFPEEMADFKLYCFSQGSWELKNNAVIFSKLE